MSIADRLDAVRDRLDAACRRAGRRYEDVALMAVSKFCSAERVAQAYAAGQRLFGESRVQEAKAKAAALAGLCPEADWQLIGTLQRNKAKAAAELFSCVQSVDRFELIEELALRAAGRPKPLGILLELHTGEESKAGFPDADALYRAAELALRHRDSLELRGLMTMAPYTADPAPIRASFRTLAAVRDRLARRFPESAWPVLSMGMSNDFELAVEEGSTLVRVGTAIFAPEDRP
jgi:pyridoxal phosphate enzyme (YggS family)